MEVHRAYNNKRPRVTRYEPYRTLRASSCALCRSSEHVGTVRQCPDRCHGCRGRHIHLASECREPCFLCKDENDDDHDHHPFDCPTRCRCSEIPKWHTLTRCTLRCYNCGNSGHLSKNCIGERKKMRSSLRPLSVTLSSSSSSSSCSLCSDSSHECTTCPLRCMGCKRGYTHLASQCTSRCDLCNRIGHSSKMCGNTRVKLSADGERTITRYED